MKKTIIALILLILVHFGTSLEAQSQELSPSFYQGVAEYRQGNYYKTVNIMDKLIQIYPDDYKARYYMAISLVKLKRVEEAKNQYVEILANAEDEDLLEYARKGLKLLDPKYYKKLKKNNFVVIEPEANTQKSNGNNTYVVKRSGLSDVKNTNDIKLTPQQQQAINQVAEQNNVSPDELNNLIKLLANNPSALKTINKLVSGKGNANPNTPEGYDQESVAKLLKMLAFNSQMDMFNFNNNNNNNNNNQMDMMSMMMGGNNQNSNNNNSMEQLMNYMSNPANKGKVDPDTLNMMFKQNMMNGFGMGGF